MPYTMMMSNITIVPGIIDLVRFEVLHDKPNLLSSFDRNIGFIVFISTMPENEPCSETFIKNQKLEMPFFQVFYSTARIVFKQKYRIKAIFHFTGFSTTYYLNIQQTACKAFSAVP